MKLNHNKIICIKLVHLLYLHVTNSGSYTRSRGIVQLTVVLSSSYLYRICKPEDGSHEPKHVAPSLTGSSPLCVNTLSNI